MKSVLVVISAIALATLAISRGPAPAAQGAPVNLTGTWKGTGHDRFVRNNAAHGMKVTWMLTQTGSTVSGTVTTTGLNPNDSSCSSCHRAKTGTFSGTLSGSTLMLTMDFPQGQPGDVTPTCAANFTGTATIADNAFTVSYTGGDSCENLPGQTIAFENGTLDVVRSTGNSFAATLTGGAQVPPVSSPGTGTGAVLLNATEDQITVNMSFAGLTSPATAAHIHGPALVGSNAGILFGLSGVPAATLGSIPEQTFSITAAQVAQLKSGQFYFNIHTGSSPDGEIRGQILIAQKFAATLTGGAQVPPVMSPGTGTGTVLLNATEDQITVDMSFAGLTSPANAAHIHGPAPVGSNAGIVFLFSGVPAATSGSIPEQTFAITAGQVADLKAGLFYFNIHTDSNTGGEIRGQIGAVPVLTVTKAGTATSSTVTSSPAGIACGADCAEAYDSGTTVTLTAGAPPSGSFFAGWSGGGCAGTAPCVLTVTANMTVTATFSPTSFTFSDDPLSVGLTLVKAAHVLELRQAINTLRSNNGLAPFVFTDPTLTAGTTPIAAVHFTELRTALNAVYTRRGRALPTYTDPTITAGVSAVKAVHVTELRLAVRLIE